MGIHKNGDGTYTVRIPRGAEVYDAAAGSLFSEATLTADEYKDFKKELPGRSANAGTAGWLNPATLPAALRDLARLGDSELDVEAALPDAQRPKVLRDLDAAAAALEAGPKGGSGKVPTDEEAAQRAEEHRGEAVTHAAASPAAQRSPVGTPEASPSGARTVTS